MYVGVPHECSTSERQKRESLEKLTVVRCCVSAGNQMGLSARAASVLSHWAISPACFLFFLSVVCDCWRALSDCQQPRTSQKQSHSPRVPTGVPSDSGPPPKVTLKVMFALPAFLLLRNAVAQLHRIWAGARAAFSLCVFRWQLAGPVSCGLLLPGPLYIGLLTLAGSLPPHNEWAISW